MTAIRFAMPVFVLLYLASSTVLAQCDPRWLPAPAPLYGVGFGRVSAAVTWDSDGDGPAQPVFVVGGRLTNAGERTIANVSLWDGVNWYPLGFLDSDVYALTIYHGDLIAGGTFSVGPNPEETRGIARWTGSHWEPLAAMTPAWAAASAFAVVGNDLYVGGLFNSIGGVPCNNIAKWDGVSWTPLGSGTTDTGPVSAIKPTSIGLIVGGFFSRAGGAVCRNVALWNGESWESMGAGLNTWVNTIQEFNNEIIVGGIFSASGTVQARSLARWTETGWVEFGGGADGQVVGLEVVDGDLFACGSFTSIGGVSAPRIARWTGAGWASVPSTQFLGPAIGVRRFEGEFVAYGWDGTLGPVLRMDSGGEWSPLGSVLQRGSAAYVGTIETNALVSGPSATPAGPSGFLKLRDGEWHNTGISGVRASLLFNGTLVAGGSRLLMQWTDSGWQTLGGGVDGGVYAMTEFQDTLIIGGTFQNAGGVASRGVAAWTGNTWHPMGVDPPLNVYALVVHNGDLYAGGAPVGSPPSGRVVRWNGSAWVAVAGDMNQAVDSLSSLGEQLIAAGRFTLSNGSPANYIVALDESGWTPLGGGADLPVADMTTYEGELIAAGSFRTIGGVTAYGLARWNGSVWSAFPGEINGVINSVAVSDADLLIAGDFTRIGEMPAPFLARWGSRPVGDLDDDRTVGIQDLANLLAAFGSCPGDENYNAAAGGLAGEACVGLDDLAVLLQAFGATCP